MGISVRKLFCQKKRPVQRKQGCESISQSVLWPRGALPLHGYSGRGDLAGALCSHPNRGPSFSASFTSSIHGCGGGRGRNKPGVQIHLKPHGQLSAFRVRPMFSCCPCYRRDVWLCRETQCGSSCGARLAPTPQTTAVGWQQSPHLRASQ